MRTLLNLMQQRDLKLKASSTNLTHLILLQHCYFLKTSLKFQQHLTYPFTLKIKTSLLQMQVFCKLITPLNLSLIVKAVLLNSQDNTKCFYGLSQQYTVENAWEKFFCEISTHLILFFQQMLPKRKPYFQKGEPYFLRRGPYFQQNQRLSQEYKVVKNQKHPKERDVGI